MFKTQSKSIIAMKGHPFTRKTEFAKYIAASQGYPILSLDHFLNPNDGQQTQDLAFRIMCQIAKSNLAKGFVQNVVIDSPLSSRSQLDQLVALAKSTEKTRLVIVECKSDNTYAWQTKFEEYIAQHPDETRYEWCTTKSWEDVEEEIRKSYDERSDGYKVPKLVVDPLSLYDGSISVTDYSFGTPFLYAIRYLIVRPEGSGEDTLVYDLWRQGHYHTSGKAESTNKLKHCNGGTHVFVEAVGTEHEATVCGACENPLLKGVATYTCKDCSFALHKECAELVSVRNEQLGAPPLEDLDGALRKGRSAVYPVLRFRCSSCEENDVDTSSNSSCKDCIFITHIKSRLLPSVIRHSCHQHFLSIQMSHLNSFGEHCNCKACGDRIGEFIWYSCKTCSKYYHYRCLTRVPIRVDHEHGGYHHRMSLQYSSEEAEDYMCYVCFERELAERRDPSCWFYSCQDCHYVAHLDCGRQGRTLMEDREG